MNMCCKNTHGFLGTKEPQTKGQECEWSNCQLFLKETQQKHCRFLFSRGFFSCPQVTKYDIYHLHLDRDSSLSHKKNAGQ